MNLSFISLFVAFILYGYFTLRNFCSNWVLHWLRVNRNKTKTAKTKKYKTKVRKSNSVIILWSLIDLRVVAIK